MSNSYSLFDYIYNISLSAVIGGVMGSVATIYWDSRKSAREQQARLRSTLIAMKSELSILWQRYMETAGREISCIKDKHYLQHMYSLSQNYFTIYDSNGVTLGELKDETLIKTIIAININLKGLVDSLRTNNAMLASLDDCVITSTEDVRKLDGKRQALKQSLIDYAEKLKAAHVELESDMAVLQQAIDTTIQSGCKL